jgi:hypothetical protein
VASAPAIAAHRMTTTRLLRRLVLPLVLAGLLCSAAPARACDGATVDTIVFQAAKYGHVSDGYSVACLREARQAQTPDLMTYSSSDPAIQAALARAVQIPARRGSSERPLRTQQSLTPTQSETTAVASADTGPLTRLINAGADSPSSVPVPVIVLGALAFLLIAGGLAGFLLRRRLEPARGPLQR